MSENEDGRAERLKAALRDNLRRRKAQDQLGEHHDMHLLSTASARGRGETGGGPARHRRTARTAWPRS